MTYSKGNVHPCYKANEPALPNYVFMVRALAITTVWVKMRGQEFGVQEADGVEGREGLGDLPDEVWGGAQEWYNLHPDCI